VEIDAQAGPIDGERVLFCVHADVGEDHIDISAAACRFQPFHWYYFGEGNPVTRQIDGAKFDARYLAICARCERDNPGMASAAQDAPWIGDSPNITPVPSRSRPS
jgi:hypothetical protein